MYTNIRPFGRDGLPILQVWLSHTQNLHRGASQDQTGANIGSRSVVPGSCQIFHLENNVQDGHLRNSLTIGQPHLILCLIDFRDAQFMEYG